MKDVMTAYKYYHQSINATLRSRCKKAGKAYEDKPFEPDPWTTEKKQAAINAYVKHVNYLKRKRDKKNEKSSNQ